MEPERGTPWDARLEDAALAFLDLEMTGLDVERDRVVEICAERVVGGRCVGRVETLLWPGDERVGGASHVHGLTPEVLRGAPTFESIVAEVVDVIDGAILVAHAAAWDARFLRAELARAGRPMELQHWIDTLVLSRRSFALPNHSLSALRAHFGLDVAGAHRAGADVAALRYVFQRCVEALGARSARDLWEVRVTERRARSEILAALAGAVEAGVPVLVTYRASRRAPEELRVVVTELVTDLDPPRAIGYLLPSRGRRELRADRILRVDPA